MKEVIGQEQKQEAEDLYGLVKGMSSEGQSKLAAFLQGVKFGTSLLNSDDAKDDDTLKKETA